MAKYLDRDIYIIIGEGWTKEKVNRELRLERYTHNFFFGGENEFDDLYLKRADEVWVFGNAENSEDYKLAVENKSDVWVMG